MFYILEHYLILLLTEQLKLKKKFFSYIYLNILVTAL